MEKAMGIHSAILLKKAWELIDNHLCPAESEHVLNGWDWFIKSLRSGKQILVHCGKWTPIYMNKKSVQINMNVCKIVEFFQKERYLMK